MSRENFAIVTCVAIGYLNVEFEWTGSTDTTSNIDILPFAKNVSSEVMVDVTTCRMSVTRLTCTATAKNSGWQATRHKEITLCGELRFCVVLCRTSNLFCLVLYYISKLLFCVVVLHQRVVLLCYTKLC